MNATRLSALSPEDLCSLHRDCGFGEGATIDRRGLARERMLKDILVWQRKIRGDSTGSADVVVPSELLQSVGRLATPVRAKAPGPADARRRKAPCENCNWERVNGLCACSFVRMDPLKPVFEVLALSGFSATVRSQLFRGSAIVELQGASLGDGERVELRMAKISEPDLHTMCHSFAVSTENAEVARVEPPRHGIKRADAPIDLTDSLPLNGKTKLQIEVCAEPFAAADFVFCILRTGAPFELQNLVSQCLALPALSAEEVIEWWRTLQGIDPCVDQDKIECTSPFEQPLSCPLTCSRIQIPARGRHCRHLRCFDLAAYLRTTASLTFHRRWRCPVCDRPVHLADIVVCGLTKTLLEQADHRAHCANIEDLLSRSPAATSTTAPSACCTPKRKRRRWAAGCLVPKVGKIDETAGSAPASEGPPRSWAYRLRAVSGRPTVDLA